MQGRIAFLPGDGVGPEVLAEARRILQEVERAFDHSFEIVEAAVGSAAIEASDDALPPATREACLGANAVLLGAVGQGVKGADYGRRPETGLLDLRQLLGNYANVRPVAMSEPLLDRSPLKAEHVRGVDLVVVRELLGGIYFGLPRGIDHGIAHNTEVYTEEQVRRISVTAFEMARARRKKVTSVDKANVLEASILWRRVAGDVARDYPDVALEHMLVDNCAMQLIANPRRFDVILTSNMFGDILSDEASVLAGSLGMLPSASLGGKVGLFEPVHGTAPDIAGKGIANPIGAILSVAMMLEESFRLPAEAAAVRRAVGSALEEGYRTADLVSEAPPASRKEIRVSTSGMGRRIAELIEVPKAA